MGITRPSSSRAPGRPARDRQSVPAKTKTPKLPNKPAKKARQPRNAVVRQDDKANTTPEPPKAILSIDFGTSALAMAYYQVSPGEDPTAVAPRAIQCVSHYECDQLGFDGGLGLNSTYCPVLIYYPPQCDGATVEPICGFEVEQLLGEPENDIHLHRDRLLEHPKLLLDDSEAADAIRKGLEMQVSALLEDGTIKDKDEPFIHVFAQALQHANEYLHGPMPSFDENADLQFVISMPVAWTPSSYNRLLLAFNAAVRLAWPHPGDRLPTKLTIAEPMAAAECLIAEASSTKTVKDGSVVMVCDAGGGTVELITFEVTREDPLRFKQLTLPDASSCGSAFLDRRMSDLAETKLKNNLVEGCQYTARTLAESRVVRSFERYDKRVTRFRYDLKYRVEELRDGKGLNISPAETLDIFSPSLTSIKELVKKQFLQCSGKGIDVTHLIMAGSFTDNLYVRNVITEVVQAHAPRAEIVTRELPVCTAVAKGGCLRALNPTHGPGRYLTVSFGLLRHIPKSWSTEQDVDWEVAYSQNPGLRELHRRHLEAVKGSDGQLYFMNQVYWFALKNDAVKPAQKFEFESRHVFQSATEPWVAQEVIYFAGNRMENYFALDDPKHKSISQLGVLNLDFNHLKSRIHLYPTFGRGEGFHFNLKVEVTLSEQFFHGLHFKAYWDPGMTAEDAEDDDRMDIDAHEVFDIGAAFELATAV